jgi:uncharacterized membrane protein
MEKTIMEKRLNKKVAPVIVAVCLIGYYVISVVILARLNFPKIITIIALIVSAVIATVIIIVLIERIKEINGGEEDDLSKY